MEILANRELTREERVQLIGKTAIDKHHIFFNKLEWEIRSSGKRIRRMNPFVIDVTRDGHNFIHDTSPIIPPLNHFQLNRLSSALKTNEFAISDQEDPLDAIDIISRAIEWAAVHERADELEIVSALNTVNCLRAQIPAIKEARVIV